MRSVTRSIPPILGAFLMAVVSGAAFADPAPAPVTTTAGPSSATTVTPAVVVANPDDKVICKTEVPTGSRFGKRVCMKKADWDLQTQIARHNMDFRPPSTTSGGH